MAKKNLFEMLVDFWKESTEKREGIGFWQEERFLVKKIADLSLEKETEVLSKAEKQDFFAEEKQGFPQEKKLDLLEEEKRFLLKEVFREEEEKRAGQKDIFLWEEKMEKRRIVPVAEEEELLQVGYVEEKAETKQEQVRKKEEPWQEKELDVEILMQEITKKLWEERESCGRRLR